MSAPRLKRGGCEAAAPSLPLTAPTQFAKTLTPAPPFPPLPPPQAARVEAATPASPSKPASPPPADIRRFLRPTGLQEARYIRMLSSLCAQTYYLPKLTVREVLGGTRERERAMDRRKMARVIDVFMF